MGSGADKRFCVACNKLIEDCACSSRAAICILCEKTFLYEGDLAAAHNIVERCPCGECCLYEEDDRGKIRHYPTGATRDSNDGKFVYNGFNCPLVEERFAAYMHQHRHQSDGRLRDASNWKKGIPSQDFLESLHRHFIDVWKIMEGYEARDDLESALCAMRFNVNGLLRNVILEADNG